MDVSTLVAIAQQAKCEARIKPRGYPLENWSWIIEPVAGYIESGGGPWPIREVEWVEINPVKEEYIGRLVPPKFISETSKIQQALDDAEIPYELINEVVRIHF